MEFRDTRGRIVRFQLPPLSALSRWSDHLVRRHVVEWQAVQVIKLVDVTGFEPATPCLQSRCSPS